MSLWFLTQWKVSTRIRKGVSLRLKLEDLTVTGIPFSVCDRTKLDWQYAKVFDK